MNRIDLIDRQYSLTDVIFFCIMNLPSLILALAAFRKTFATYEKINDIHCEINGRITKALAEIREAAFQLGHRAGVHDERFDSVDRKNVEHEGD